MVQTNFTLKRIEEFLYYLEKNNVFIEENNIEHLKSFEEYIDLDAFKLLQSTNGMAVSNKDQEFIRLSSLRISWTTEIQQNIEFLYGSVFIAGMSSALRNDSHFWKTYNSPVSGSAEETELKKLAVLQRSAYGDDGTFGCFYREPPKYPCDIYFYDNGIYYPTDFTLETYYDAMLENKAVVLWQYFYIPAEEIVKKLDGLTCKGWISMYSDLVDVPRAIGVAMNMERIIRVFPTIFPDYDVSFYQKKLYELNQILGR